MPNGLCRILIGMSDVVENQFLVVDDFFLRVRRAELHLGSRHLLAVRAKGCDLVRWSAAKGDLVGHVCLTSPLPVGYTRGPSPHPGFVYVEHVRHSAEIVAH